MKTGTTRMKGMAMRRKSSMTRGGPIKSTKRRTRSTTKGQTAGVRATAMKTHRGPMNFLG